MIGGWSNNSIALTWWVFYTNEFTGSYSDKDWFIGSYSYIISLSFKNYTFWRDVLRFKVDYLKIESVGGVITYSYNNLFVLLTLYFI